jgi:hypothetical protein
VLGEVREAAREVDEVGGIGDHELDVVTEQPAGGVEVGDGQLGAPDELLTDRRSGAGQRGGDPEPDVVGGPGPAGGDERGEDGEHADEAAGPLRASTGVGERWLRWHGRRA